MKSACYLVWGGIRFVRSRFSFLSSRIVQKRKQWLGEALELEDTARLSDMLGPHWWFHFGAALCEVIMPSHVYMVGPPHDLCWDNLGLSAYARDCTAWPGAPSDDLMHQSQFTLFRDIGGHLFGTHSREAHTCEPVIRSSPWTGVRTGPGRVDAPGQIRNRR